MRVRSTIVVSGQPGSFAAVRTEVERRFRHDSVVSADEFRAETLERALALALAGAPSDRYVLVIRELSAVA